MAGSSAPGEFEVEGAKHLVSATSSSGRKYVQCEGFLLPHHFSAVSERIRAMEIRSDDVWLCGIPLSGTRWVQEAVWCIANDVDLETAKMRTLRERFPLLDVSVFNGVQTSVEDTDPSLKLPEGSCNSIDTIEKLPSRRFVKSYLPFVLLPEALLSENKAKIVCISRNPRDLCIAMYRAIKCICGYDQGFEAFAEYFMIGRMFYLPYWEHILQFWRRRNDLDILFITHEEMKKDLEKVIRKIAQFLDKEVDEGQMPNLMEHLLSFEYMIQYNPENRDVDLEEFVEHDYHKHLRGPSGRWRDVMTESVVQRFENWEEEHLKDTDYSLALEY